jgi:hypothetical protein
MDPLFGGIAPSRMAQSGTNIVCLLWVEKRSAPDNIPERRHQFRPKSLFIKGKRDFSAWSCGTIIL